MIYIFYCAHHSACGAYPTNKTAQNLKIKMKRAPKRGALRIIWMFLLEERQNILTGLVGDAERLNAELSLNLESL